MDVVALVALCTSADVEAPLLAADLGATVYDTALLLRAPSPALLLRTDDRARALRLLASVRGRGHDAIACDAATIVSTDEMVHVRSNRFTDHAWLITDARAIEHALPWSDILVLVRATHRTRTEQAEKSDERKLSLGRAAMSGGLLVTKTVTSARTHATEHRDQVLYVFREGGAPRPKLDRVQAGARGLVSSSSVRSVDLLAHVVALARVRARAPHTPYR